MANEFERVTLQYSALLDVIEQVRFYGINGLIQLENQKISPFYFHLSEEHDEKFLIIIFSIPVFQSLDSNALTTGMEYFSAILKNIFCENKSVSESEIMAFNDIKNLPLIRSQDQDIIPYEDYAEKIELQLRMKVRTGIQIFPVAKLIEDISTKSMQHLKELRKAKAALVTIQSNLREYSARIANKYRISVKPYLFRTALENRFEPSFISVFSLDATSQVKDDFSVLVFTTEVIKRISKNELKILIAYEIIYDLLKDKFSRGLVEREIYQILSNGKKNDPNFFIVNELKKFFTEEEISNAQNAIKQTIEDLLEEKYPIMRLD
ncbi:hypothetical protein CEE45_05685 [Candidatus Heimdallarchaeota archaeon B3_Heim]|nr:MAG: hypothetical protein CEE45_05685 [Candidatus Heimdallarchaeota archaeon B3_Heim]